MGAGPAVEAALARLIRDVPDFPSPGIVFKDITPLLGDPDGFRVIVEALSDEFGASAAAAGVDKVVGVEARGFVLGAPVAYRLHAGFVPVRKAGKLPSAVHAESYALEYGSATVELHVDAFAPGDRVLVVDDVLATGGTAAATVELVRRAGGVVVGVLVLIELVALHGRAQLPGVDVRALLTVPAAT